MRTPATSAKSKKPVKPTAKSDSEAPKNRRPRKQHYLTKKLPDGRHINKNTSPKSAI